MTKTFKLALTRFFATSVELPEFTNKDKHPVVQFSVSDDVDQCKFGGETPYNIMFGPDICGYSTKKVHVILNYKGENHPIEKDIACETDQLTHVYTLIIKPDNTYIVLTDNVEKQLSSLYNNWKMLPP